jgi:hypothetical protein
MEKLFDWNLVARNFVIRRIFEVVGILLFVGGTYVQVVSGIGLAGTREYLINVVCGFAAGLTAGVVYSSATDKSGNRWAHWGAGAVADALGGTILLPAPIALMSVQGFGLFNAIAPLL